AAADGDASGGSAPRTVRHHQVDRREEGRAPGHHLLRRCAFGRTPSRGPRAARHLRRTLSRRRDRAARLGGGRGRPGRGRAGPACPAGARHPRPRSLGPPDPGALRAVAQGPLTPVRSLMYTQQGVLDRESAVLQYGPAVRRAAAQLVARLPANVDIDDLVQAGMIGLLDAVSRYDPSHGAQFETFAMQRVRGAMLDELRGSDWMPRSVRRNQRTIERAVHAAEQALKRPPTEA